MKTSVAIVFLSIGILVTANFAQSEKSDGFFASCQKAWEPYMHRARKHVYATAMATMTPMIKLSKRFMDPTGGEIIDKLISDIPILSNAMEKNDGASIHRILNEHQKAMETITQHITHPQVREIHSERIDAYRSLMTCVNQGQCGYKAYFRYLSGYLNPLRKLYTLLSD